MNIEHISVSRKQCFDTCKAQYKYRYHLKIVSEEPVADHFTYGKIVHKVAECYVEEKGKRKILEIGSDVLSGKILLEASSASPPLPEQYKNKFQEHLKNIELISEKIGFDGLIEWEFNHDLDSPNKKMIKGFVDRLIIRDEKYYILDYKTTKKGPFRKNKSNIQQDLQLRCYGKMVQDHFGAKAENIKAALYYLEGGELVSTKFTQDSLESAIEDMSTTYDKIKDMSAESAMGRTGIHCRFCDYKKKCPWINNKTMNI